MKSWLIMWLAEDWRALAWSLAGHLALYVGLLLPSPAWSSPRPEHVLATLLLGAALVSLSVIDIRNFRLPDVLTLPLIATGVLLSALSGLDTALWHAAAAAFGFGALYGLDRLYEHLRGHPGLGLGDAKLFAAAGAWVGPESLPSALLLACVLALAIVLLERLRGRPLDATTAVAFGPYLALGLWTVWLYGPLL